MEGNMWIVDDAGSLINMVNGHSYDYFDEIVDIMNEYEKNIEELQKIARHNEKIDKYQGFVCEGRGYIKDHQECKKIIEFDFPIFDEKKAKKCLEICLDYLNNK